MILLRLIAIVFFGSQAMGCGMLFRSELADFRAEICQFGVVYTGSCAKRLEYPAAIRRDFCFAAITNKELQAESYPNYPTDCDDSDKRPFTLEDYFDVLSGCREIGQVYIRNLGGFRKNVLDKMFGDAFSKVEKIQRGLELSNVEVSDNALFPELSEIGGDFSVSRTSAGAFTGFPALKKVGGAVRLTRNSNSLELTGLNALQSAGMLWLESPVLDMAHFDGLRKVTGSIFLDAAYYRNLKKLLKLEDASAIAIALHCIDDYEYMMQYIDNLDKKSTFYFTSFLELRPATPPATCAVSDNQYFGFQDTFDCDEEELE